MSAGMLHIALHFVVPFLVAAVFFRGRLWTAFFILCASMLVDLDHLLANPIYDPGRCSICFHPLHHPIAIGVYALLLLPKQTRLIGLGLLLHMALDGLDCVGIP